MLCSKRLQTIKFAILFSFASIDTMAVVIMISLKINNKKWREELTDLSDLDTQGFVGVIVDSVSLLSCSNFEKVRNIWLRLINNQIFSIKQYPTVSCFIFSFNSRSKTEGRHLC